VSARPDVDDELSRGAARHALYLARNPEQKERWPDAHEEFVDHDGFTVEGALAGARSVIHFGVTPAQAVQSWMATFYHRLPLLDPGLLGVGIGDESGVVVLDVQSLVAPARGSRVVVWPVPDASGVPRRFAPEIPNPVPDEDESQWGFPI